MEILVSSTEFRAGKTSLIFALSKIFRLSFSYKKPTGPSPNERRLLGSNTNGITFIEGGKSYKTGFAKGEGDTSIRADKTVLIARYCDDIFDEIALASKVMTVDAVILNEIPANKLGTVRETTETSDNIVGLIPYDKFLGGISISTIKECVDGLFLTVTDGGFIIEEMLIGAMSPPCALDWLKKVKNAALLTGGDRVDLQKIALDTGIKCLVLTGNFEPPQVIVKRAEKLGACIILTEFDTLTAMEKIMEVRREEVNERKKDRIVEIFKSNINKGKIREILEI